jgi:hypothetical protein
MRTNRKLLSCMMVVLAGALLASSCSSEHEDGEDDEGGVLGPSAVSSQGSSPAAEQPAPTPSPTATPTPVPTDVAATPTPTPPPAPTPSPSLTVSYDQDIRPILDADCVRCHRDLSTYSGVMAYVQPGNSNSLLIAETRPGGGMNGYLSGDRNAKADLIRRWIVDYRAAQSR